MEGDLRNVRSIEKSIIANVSYPIAVGLLVRGGHEIAFAARLEKFFM